MWSGVALTLTERLAGERDGLSVLGAALLLMALLHGTLLLGGSFERTYDALIHIFFASHYAQAWFDPWEPRWYTGFWMVSYPPLAHYLIAALGKTVGLKLAFALVQLFALLLLTVGVYRFSRLFVPPRAAGYATIALALSSSLAETVHVFGQLPTTLSLAFLLNAIPFAWAWTRTGHWVFLAQGVAWMAATTAAHHVTTLFGSVFFTAPVLLVAVLAPLGAGGLRGLPRHWRATLPGALRAGAFAALTVVMLVVVVLSYWAWSRADPITQVPIPHASRFDFLANPTAGLVFWVVPWASTLLFLPYAWAQARTWRWPLVASLTLLFVLGTGGTTPIPRALLRGAFDILTLDRFTFWATMLILPFVGLAVQDALGGRLGARLTAVLGARVRHVAVAGLVVLTCGASMWVSTLTRHRKFQPPEIDITPIVSFLEKDQHWQYRYLDLGFGDQMAWLSANTRATTPDGNYHSARRLPELTTTAVERLEGAKFSGEAGLESLRYFLTTPEKHHLKFIFSNDAFYDPLLHFTGWHRLGTLENGVALWEREDVPPLPARLPRPELPTYQVVMWGVLPPAAFVVALASLGLAARRRTHPDELEPRAQAAPAPAPTGAVMTAGRVRVVRGVLVGAVAVLSVTGAVAAWGSVRAARAPERVVLRYWDALDFRRYPEAYALVQPTRGLTQERWLLDLSARGGLRASYAKLADLRVLSVKYDGSPPARAFVRVRLRWFTALGSFTDVRDHELRRSTAGWRIVIRPDVQERAPVRFTLQPSLSAFTAPRRLTSPGDDSASALDRPRLDLPEARLVRFDSPSPGGPGGRASYAIIGTVRNEDARPADLTISGALRDASGRAIARVNAGRFAMHKLLPGETTPFMVLFEGINAPPRGARVAGASVDARAVVTGRGLTRNLGAWSEPDGDSLRVQVANTGTREATVPRVLLGVYDARGLAWMIEAFVPLALAPGDTAEVTLRTSLPPGYSVLGNAERSVDGVLLSGRPGGAGSSDAGALPGGRRFRLWLDAFQREGE